MALVKDDPALLEAAFTQAAAQADAVITSGGVSVGEADHTRAMMKKLGDVAFWRIAMRPGRPMAVGRIAATGLQAKTAPSAQPASASSYQNDINASTGGAVLFGLPGNPVAVMVTFLAYVRPALLRMMGSTRTAPPLLRATSTEAIRKKPGRTEYQRGRGVDRDRRGRQDDADPRLGRPQARRKRAGGQPDDLPDRFDRQGDDRRGACSTR